MSRLLRGQQGSCPAERAAQAAIASTKQRVKPLAPTAGAAAAAPQLRRAVTPATGLSPALAAQRVPTQRGRPLLRPQAGRPQLPA
jgi:hypothetical protein